MTEMRRAEVEATFQDEFLGELAEGKKILVPLSDFDDAVFCGGRDGGDDCTIIVGDRVVRGKAFESLIVVEVAA